MGPIRATGSDRGGRALALADRNRWRDAGRRRRHAVLSRTDVVSLKVVATRKNTPLERPLGVRVSGCRRESDGGFLSAPLVSLRIVAGRSGLYRQPGASYALGRALGAYFAAHRFGASPAARRSERSRGRRAASLTFINLTNGDIPPEVGCLGRGVWRGRSRTARERRARRSCSRWCSLSRSCRDIFSSRSSRKSALSRWQSPARQTGGGSWE